MGWSLVKTVLAKNWSRYLDRTADPKLLTELLERLRPHHYGFKPIRLGPKKDGGYIVPEIIRECDVCLSAGVADSIAFELDLFDKFGIRSCLSDYSVDQPDEMPPEFSFRKKFLASYPSEETITIDEWVDMEGCGDKRMVVQMDIEGSEYETLLNVSYDRLRSIDILVLEVHGLERIFSRSFYPIAESFFGRLLSQFNVFHLHPNNVGSVATGLNGFKIPSLLEITFISKDLCYDRPTGPVAQLPLRIDFPNRPSLPDIKLGAPWF